MRWYWEDCHFLSALLITLLQLQFFIILVLPNWYYYFRLMWCKNSYLFKSIMSLNNKKCQSIFNIKTRICFVFNVVFFLVNVFSNIWNYIKTVHICWVLILLVYICICVNIYFSFISEPNLLVRACNQLGQFLQHRETNLR